MKALILIDLQNDFCPGGMSEVPGGGQAVAVANRLMDRFDLVVSVRDWHPGNHTSFAANHLWRRPGQTIVTHGIPQLLWPIHCVQNSFGAELAIALRQEKIHRHFFKGGDPEMDSYGGFFDNARKNESGLASFLHEKQVEELYLCGLPLEFSVRNTALDALALGFKTWVLSDACMPLHQADGGKILEEIVSHGGIPIRSDEI